MIQPVSKKALLKLGYECNNNCLLCHSVLKKKYPSLATEQILEKIRKVKNKGLNFVLFSGGEATIRKDIFEISRFVKENDMQFGLVTNGRLFSYGNYLKKLVESNLRYAYISFYSSKKRIQNEITGTNSFDQTTEGIKNAAMYGEIELIINIPLNKMNINDLKEIIDLLQNKGAKNIKFSFLEVKGNAIKNFDKIGLKVGEAAENVKEAVNYGQNKGLNILVGGFPLCLIEGYEKETDDFESQNIIYMSESFENDIFPIDHRDKTKTERCKDCEKDKVCHGLDKNYIKIFSDNELKPFKKVSNSACFIPIKKTGKLDCKDYNPGENDIILKEGESYTIFRYNSSDFSNEAIKRIKEKGQVYLQSGKNMIKLKESQDPCGKIFQAVNINVFEKCMVPVEKKIKSLKGKILDIGCGEMYFYNLFKEMIKNKKISYVGVDPAEVKIKNKDMVFIKNLFENVYFGEDKFDNVLMLGSYNHLREITYSLRKIYKILKPGGKLLICDDEAPIILSRRKGNAKKAFEHYNNYGAETELQNLRSLDFKILKVMPVSKQTNNRWLIMCMK